MKCCHGKQLLMKISVIQLGEDSWEFGTSVATAIQELRLWRFLSCPLAIVLSTVSCPSVHVLVDAKLQSLVYDIFPPSTAITDCATGLEKPPVNGQVFVDAQNEWLQFGTDS